MRQESITDTDQLDVTQRKSITSGQSLIFDQEMNCGKKMPTPFQLSPIIPLWH